MFSKASFVLYFCFVRFGVFFFYFAAFDENEGRKGEKNLRAQREKKPKCFMRVFYSSLCNAFFKMFPTKGKHYSIEID